MDTTSLDILRENKHSAEDDAVRLEAAALLILASLVTWMKPSFKQSLIEVWRQILVEGAKSVILEGGGYAVRTTPNRGLRQVDFTFAGRKIRGLEQNPATKSRWAQMARSGKKVMQFLSAGRYIANVVNGKVTLYVR
jgi:hypothetical protein